MVVSFVLFKALSCKVFLAGKSLQGKVESKGREAGIGWSKLEAVFVGTFWGERAWKGSRRWRAAMNCFQYKAMLAGTYGSTCLQG